MANFHSRNDLSKHEFKRDQILKINYLLFS